MNVSASAFRMIYTFNQMCISSCFELLMCHNIEMNTVLQYVYLCDV